VEKLALLFSIIFTNLYSKPDIETNFIQQILDLRQIDKNAYSEQAKSLTDSQYEDLTSCIDHYNSLTRNLVIAGFEYLKEQKGSSMPATASLLNLELTKLFQTNTDFKEKEVKLAELRKKIELLVESQSQQKSMMAIPATIAALISIPLLLHKLYNWSPSKQSQPDNSSSTSNAGNTTSKQRFFKINTPKFDSISAFYPVNGSQFFKVPLQVAAFFTNLAQKAQLVRKRQPLSSTTQTQKPPDAQTALQKEAQERLTKEQKEKLELEKRKKELAEKEQLERENADKATDQPKKELAQEQAEALYQAVFSDNIPTVTTLLGQKAQPNIKATKHKKSPLFMAIRLNKSKVMIDLLLKNTSPDSLLQESGPSHRDTVLNEAARGEDINLVDQLIRLGGHPDFINKLTINPIFTAFFCNNTKMLKHLLEKGADINSSKNPFERTLLIYATLYKNLELAKFLLEHGANLAVATSYLEGNNTPLHIAARSPDMIKFVKLFLDHARSKGILDTILHIVNTEHPMLSKLLSSPRPKTKEKLVELKEWFKGQTPLQLAIFCHNEKASQLLRKSDPNFYINTIKNWLKILSIRSKDVIHSVKYYLPI
jgi:ankyrin repeat protein